MSGKVLLRRSFLGQFVFIFEIFMKSYDYVPK